ncbi:tryptophan-rich sensory protein [Natronomonas sp. F2-12]|jgi:tryptophan-rich sensory protein|uniref:Tryptophan-rich sensory protein n=1 Tax=Natronomonas aquatica TaxID=2841590 RepID=A0A9R1CWB8_9EURY|nr:TspO/MBR family protein [Natronomonas aquatica]MCQ4334968.1 tryptophan-rich sensory protein [Natronomonas aquatica]
MFQRFGLTTHEGLIALGVILSVNALGALPAVFAGADTNWIDRPWFYPPEILFPIVWTLLFTLMGVALFIVWRHGTDQRPVRVAFGTFAIQFALNLAWTPVFFGLQRAGLGLVVIGMLWVAIVATIIVFSRVSRTAAVLLVPYLAWVSFAVVLNYAIYAAG